MNDELETTAPPAGEEIHMPASSIIPLVNAAGLALTIVSLTMNHLLTVLGGVVFVISAIIWIRDTRRDIADLPLDHSSH